MRGGYDRSSKNQFAGSKALLKNTAVRFFVSIGDITISAYICLKHSKTIRTVGLLDGWVLRSI